MATLLDAGLLNFFSPLFVFLLIFVIVYSILIKAKLLESKNLAGLLAFCAAAITFAIPQAVQLVSLSAPYFVVFAVVLFIGVFVFLGAGVKSEVITNYLSKDPVFFWGVFAALVIILLFIFSQVYGADIAPDSEDASQTDELNNRVKDILFSPSLLGALFILIMIAFAVKLVTGKI